MSEKIKCPDHGTCGACRTHCASTEGCVVKDVNTGKDSRTELYFRTLVTYCLNCITKGNRQ